MSDQLPTFEREMLRVLFSREGWCDLYLLHEQFLLSPGQISHAVRHFVDMGLIESKDLEARLTDRGRHWVFANRRSIFLEAQKRSWATPAPFTTVRPQSPTEPFLPHLKGVNRKFFTSK